MNNVVTLAGGAAAAVDTKLPVAREHLATLQAWLRSLEYSSGPLGAYLPPAVVEPVRGELEAVLGRSTPKQAALQLVGRLIAAYPARAADTDMDLKAYMALLVDEIGALPDWATAAALPKVWRTKRFRPSVAEVVEAIQAEMLPIQHALEGLRVMERTRAEEEEEAERRTAAAAERAKINAEREAFRLWSEAEEAAGRPGNFRAYMAARKAAAEGSEAA